MMGDQTFTCGRYKDRTFAEIAERDLEFCEKVLKSREHSKYEPEEFKLYLLSRRAQINESNVTSFVRQWNNDMRAEFLAIIGQPKIATRIVHPQAELHPTGNLGVFIRYFVKKCVFNAQNVNATNYNIDTFAAIFPFKVSKSVSPVTVPIRKLFDKHFFTSIEQFLHEHFVDKNVDDRLLELFLSNIGDFRRRHFDQSSIRKLKTIVADAQDSERGAYAPVFANDYLREFPRLSQFGVARYSAIGNSYNSLCAAFGRPELQPPSRRCLQKLPEITCLEVLSLLEPDFYAEQRREYVRLFEKYLFFFAHAIECDGDNALFFVDDPLYECLKGYAEYRNSRAPAESLLFPIWQMTLVHRRSQELDGARYGYQYDVDEANLRDIRRYVETFAGIRSAIVDYVLPTNLILLGIPFLTPDAILNVFYTRANHSQLADFYELIIRAAVCPLPVAKCVIYNAFLGCEASVDVPDDEAKSKILEFLRKYNHYKASHKIPVESILTGNNLEKYFEVNTIDWESKPGRKQCSDDIFVL